MPLPFPQVMFPDVTCISPAFLRENGIRGLLLDIDGTLMQTRDAMPRAEVLAWMERLRREGFFLYILSNNKDERRVRAFAEAVTLPWQHLARKPLKRGFVRAFAETGLAPGELAVVGDQIFTDMWGARRCGCRALLVESTDTYLWYFPLRRLFELPFRREKP